MKIAKTLLEARAGVRFRLSQAQMPLMRAAFAAIGEGTVVIRPLMLSGIEHVTLGKGVLIREDAWIATEGAHGRISVGDNCYFGFRTHLHSIDPVAIGQGCVIADNVMITTTDHERGNRHGVTGTGPVVIGDNVFLGQNVVVLGGVTIGDGATVAAGAVVVKDVPVGAVVGGVPAKVLQAAGRGEQ